MHPLSSEIQRKKGYPTPLGASAMDHGINFALFSQHAEGVTLCLFAKDEKHPFAEIPLDPAIHKTGHIWHILLKNITTNQIEYGYKMSGPKDPPYSFDEKKIVSDPYAKGMNSSNNWAHKKINEEGRLLLGKVICDAGFDWQNDRRPHIPLDEVVLYEMHVRAFTQHPSSKVKHPGTYLGVIEKIPHLKSLGINAIELMPIFEFNECELHRVNPKTGQSLYNVWGYSTINFFSPMNRFASSADWTASMDE
ncbi:MAG: alpha-amylase family glycosyl hydrolase, partial [Chlamydiota bacterium]